MVEHLHTQRDKELAYVIELQNESRNGKGCQNCREMSILARRPLPARQRRRWLTCFGVRRSNDEHGHSVCERVGGEPSSASKDEERAAVCKEGRKVRSGRSICVLASREAAAAADILRRHGDETWAKRSPQGHAVRF